MYQPDHRIGHVMQAAGMVQMAGEQVRRHHEDVQCDNQPGSVSIADQPSYVCCQ